jgi:hypothetical protein
MKVALLRVGIDSGCGGMQGPLFEDGSFELMPIPDKKCVDPRTYGNTPGRRGRYLIEYFPASRQAGMRNQSVHLDPEFATFTYGDPTPPKRGLRRLEGGDLLVFYCGLQGWGFPRPPALYLAGYFEVEAAGLANEFSASELTSLFSENFHVRHPSVFAKQKDDLVLVRGRPTSRLFEKAHCLSTLSKNRVGGPLKIISPEMQNVFGAFGGRLSFQRSPTRWVDGAFVKKAAEYVMTLD